MDIRTDEISSIIRQQIESFDVDLRIDEVGTVLEVGDGIARAYGLEKVMASEMVEFENGSFGLALNLEEDSVGIVILGDYVDIREGQTVKRTGRVLSVPAGEGLLGRVVNPLSQPIDGKGPIQTTHFMPLEGRAPGIADRQPVKEPLMTGVKAIDGMIPIGRGQRELIIGDRETGKSAIAIDTIINQKGGDVICVYVAIGLKASTVAGVVETLREHGAMDYTIVVSATANDPAPMQYIAPYGGCAMAEYFMYEQNRHTLCVYDAQTKAMKKVAGKLRLDLAQYRELEAFAQFASDLDPGTKAQLARGERTVESLKQPQFEPWPMEEQVATIFAVGQGFMDDLPVEQIKRFERELTTALRAMPSVALAAIKETGVLDDSTAATLKEEIAKFKRDLWRPGAAPGEPAKEEGPGQTKAPAASAKEEGAEEAEAPAPESAREPVH